jgi:hypothetical protein
MAKINEEVLVIKISTLLPDQADMTAVMDQDNIAALKAVIEQMAGDDNRTLVEIETIKD